ncbi:TIGR03936 family radical SAM-associated protein [Microbispora sp. ATCC PTA-5024]|uniref:TIGR03936 family radical SAM-associated protein n=1 Tax=Microbispora sp. ATCC PTA-5024 TaxID=316330 RepID=UPI0003DD3052|nr:TIGR03936 family radical SAM-associated protein [Microbispora sp. ATCC PTA-5024]ETK32035.1 radical SAM protein [Microbispora sp. ATCC PTA-5024]
MAQRLRVRYAKRGRLRFTSHRDISRAVERAVRRAGLPVAYSAGFSPHPKISYAGAAPTGVASEAEYLEIGVSRPCDPRSVLADLDASLPPGLDVVDVVEARSGTLADRLEASVWEVRLPGADPAEAEAAVKEFWAADLVEVERLTKKGMRRFDARQAVHALALTDEAADGGIGEAAGASGRTAGQKPVQPCVILRMVVRHETPAVRPDDVLTGLRLVAGFAPPSPPEVTRLAQGPLDAVTGEPADPFDLDRAGGDR